MSQPVLNSTVVQRAEMRSGPFRQVAESFVLLAVAVVMFRSFAVEGYLISTGSMAPSLLGYHRRVICPSCHFRFARGAAFDADTQSTEVAWADFESSSLPAYVTQCPNCGQSDIPAQTVPRNEGDQLLVHKHAYLLRSPRRWEVVVFRNPGDARQAYVKRVVGLPGERLEILDGDIYADGELRRKPYVVQRAIRIPVSEFASLPDTNDPDWAPRWVAASPETDWVLEPSALVFRGQTTLLGERTDWVEYRHWIRAGGQHRSTTTLLNWPADVELPNPQYAKLQYSNGELACTGVLSELERKHWLMKAEDPDYQRAINELYVRSHVAPVTDEYGYNAAGTTEENLVHDFMVSLDLEEVVGIGRFQIELTDGENRVQAVFDFSDFRVDLLVDDDPVPVRQGRLQRQALAEPMTIELSLFDRQVILAVNEEPLFAPLEFGPRSGSVAVRRPVRIGAAGIDCSVKKLRLFRDVYYTQKPREGATTFQLGADEFFVLGDNSPVSIDSRVWENPAIPRNALIGKPFVVHLPSRQGRIKWGGKTRYIRLPDFSRVRMIH